MATNPATAEAAAPIDLNAVVTAYTRMRDARSSLKRDYEAKDNDLKEKMSRLEVVLLRHLNTHGMDAVKTSAGTFYRQEEIKPNITDDSTFYAWIVENDAVSDALERRVKVSFVKDFMENHDGLPPPGVSASRNYVVRVRRSS